MTAKAKTNVATARAAWGDGLPDWVLTLAEACDEMGSQGKVSLQLGFRGSARVCATLANNYRGRLDRIEAAVRAHLMAENVVCPNLGEITIAACLDHQEHAAKGNRTSAIRALMSQKCPLCIRYSKGGA